MQGHGEGTGDMGVKRIYPLPISLRYMNYFPFPEKWTRTFYKRRGSLSLEMKQIHFQPAINILPYFRVIRGIHPTPLKGLNMQHSGHMGQHFSN